MKRETGTRPAPGDAPRTRRPGRRGAVSAPTIAFVVVALAVAVVGASLAAAAGDSPWVGSGSGTTNVTSDGSTGPAVFTYQSNQFNGSWTFSTEASASGLVELQWHYEGFHSWFQVRVRLDAFVAPSGGAPATTQLVNAGPTNCCAGPPSGGFDYSGTTTLAVNAGDTYGFTMTGSHFDSAQRLEGTLTVTTVSFTPTISTPASVEASLAPSDATVEAGAASIDVAKLPLTALVPPAETPITQQPITQQPITQQPITQQPITQQPITQQPITQQPITQQPITQFGFGDLATLLSDPDGVLGKALGGVTLDTLPTSYPGGWPAILQGTPLAARPPQNVTLRQVLTASPRPGPLNPSSGVPQLQIGQLDFLNSKLRELPLFALAFGSTPLLDLDPVNISVATGTTSFPDGTPVLQRPASADWAEVLAGPPFNCAAGCALDSHTVISAALAGAPITQQPITQQPITQQPITQQPITQQPITQQPITQQPITQQPIAQMPIAQMPLQAPITQQPITQQPITQQPFTYFATSASPITQHPITQQPITQQGSPQLPAALGSLRLLDILASGRSAPACAAGVRLGAPSKLGTIAVASLQNASSVVLSGAAGTLADAYCAGRIVPAATLQTLAGAVDLRSYTLGDIAWYGDLVVIDLLVALDVAVERFTMGDLVAMMINRLSVDWESLSPEALSEVGDNPAGRFTLTATFTLVGGEGSEGGSGPATVTLTLPPFARYVTGSAALGEGSLNEPVVTTETNGEEKRSILTFELADVPFDGAQQLSVEAYAGFVLGPQSAEVSIETPSEGPSATASTAITVADTFGDAGGGNDVPPTAVSLPARPGIGTPGGEVLQSYIRSAGDVDVFKVPNPGPGFRISAHLTNLPADYDLSIVGPEAAPLRDVPAGAPLQEPPIRDNGVSTENRNSSLEPAAAQDLPITQQPITQQPLDQSQNRGTNPEDAAVLTTGAAGGDYLVRVAGYNGAQSPHPYSLRVEVTPVSPEPSCSPWPYRSAPGTPGSAPPGIPAGTNTVFLVNRKRLAQVYGQTAADGVMSSLTTIAGASALGVSGVVVPVDGYPDVGPLYAAWDANPCSASASNGVASAIAERVDAIRATTPTLEYVVVVGGFDQIPPFALPDVTRIANETGNAQNFADNQYFGWASTGHVLSDDPYYDTDPVDVGGAQVFVPDLVGGRLVETPGQITSQLTAFQTFGGRLNRSSAFVSGYDFVKDGATAANGAFGTFTEPGGQPLQVRQALINDTFTRSDLLGALFPAGGAASLNVLNGHFDPYRTLTAAGSAAGTLDVVSTADLDARPNALNGSVLLTVGCHSGLAVSDVIVGTTSPLRRDWAEALADQKAHWAANTGYGLGDTDAVAYSEQLVVNMARRLDGSVSIGEALTRAKADYFLQKGGNLTAYDRKAVAEMTLYGLPFYGVGVAPTAIPGAPAGLPAGGPVAGTSAATTPASAAIVKDPVSGLDSALFSATPSFTLETTPRGRFYTNAGQVNAANYRPLVPQISMAATRVGLVPHSAFVESLTSTDEQGFDPVYQTPTVDQGSVSPELTFGDAGFPTKLPAVVTTTLDGQRVSQLNLSTGQFFVPEGGSASAPRGVGVMRQFTRIAGRVFYTAPGVTDFDPPTILQTTAVFASGAVAFTVDLDDPSAVRVYVLFRDGSAPQWKPVDLAKAETGGTRWTGGGPAASAGIEYVVQACDANGNCGWSSNKAKYFTATPPPPPTGNLDVGLSGAGGPTTFTGPVTATATAAEGVTLSYAVDGGPATAGNSVQVSAEGLHTVRFDGSDGSSRTVSFLIDTGPPSIVIQTPAEPNGREYSIDQPLAAAFACLDTGSGIASCAATMDGAPATSGSPLPWTPGPHTLTVTATDLAGGTKQESRTYRVVFPFTGLLPPVDNAPTINEVKAGSAVPVKFSLGGNRGLQIFASGSPSSAVTQCGTGTVDPVTTTVAASSSGLLYDPATGQYTYVWKTDKKWAGTCRTLSIALVDGTPARKAVFRVK